jgi:hypothetical protein
MGDEHQSAIDAAQQEIAETVDDFIQRAAALDGVVSDARASVAQLPNAFEAVKDVLQWITEARAALSEAADEAREIAASVVDTLARSRESAIGVNAAACNHASTVEQGIAQVNAALTEQFAAVGSLTQQATSASTAIADVDHSLLETQHALSTLQISFSEQHARQWSIVPMPLGFLEEWPNTIANFHSEWSNGTLTPAQSALASLTEETRSTTDAGVEELYQHSVCEVTGALKEAIDQLFDSAESGLRKVIDEIATSGDTLEDEGQSLESVLGNFKGAYDALKPVVEGAASLFGVSPPDMPEVA